MTDIDKLHRRIERIDTNTDAVEIITLVAEMTAEVAAFANKLELRIAELEARMAEHQHTVREGRAEPNVRLHVLAKDDQLCEHGNWPDECEKCLERAHGTDQ